MNNANFEVIRKRQNFTMIDNDLLKDKELSWQAKGVISFMLSLPTTYFENGKPKVWIINRTNIVNNGKNGKSSVDQIIKELRANGYILLIKYVDKHNRTLGWRYKVYEQKLISPVESYLTIKLNDEQVRCFYENVLAEYPEPDFPHLVIPNVAFPDMENEVHNNTNKNKTINNNIVINHINPQITINTMEQYLAIIHENISYDIISETLDKEMVDELVEIMLEVVCATTETIRISKQDISFSVVKQRFLKINSEHIEYVIDCIKSNTTKVHNIKNYLVTALYNAPLTISNYYTAIVNHDMYGKTM